MSASHGPDQEHGAGFSNASSNTEHEPSRLKSHFAYSRLHDAEIRLVRFRRDSLLSDPISLELITSSIDKAPPYIALSYVWGDSSDTKPVVIGSQSFQVTQNLYSALLHIRKLTQYFEQGMRQNCDIPNAELFLWIDAISIDQENLSEKADQVPRMTEIFSKAHNVLIWFGTVEQMDLDLCILQMMFSIMEKIDPVDGFPSQEREEHPDLQHRDSQNVFGTMLLNYTKLVTDQWFTRVWVLQEYTMSRRTPCAMVSDSVFSFQSLYSWVKNFSQFVNHLDEGVRTVVGPIVETVTRLAALAFGPTYMRDWFASTEFQEKSLAWQILWILMNIGSKASTLPHD